METALIVILPIVTASLTIASFFISRSTENRRKGQNEGVIKTTVEKIDERVSDIWRDQKQITGTLNSHLERIIIVEQKVNRAHERIDGLSARGSRYNGSKEKML